MSNYTRFRCALLLLLLTTGPGTAWLEAQEASPEPAASDPEPEERTTRSRRRPRVDNSNTGYVDNAIVGRQLRIRFDQALSSNRPDRAEFIYGKCACFSAFGQDSASPGPTADVDILELELAYEHAFMDDRFSIFLEAPFRYIDLAYPDGFGQPAIFGQPGREESGLGDIRLGIKYGLVARADRYLTLQLRWYVATGAADEALGTDHDSIEPGLLFYSEPAPRWTIGSELRWWHPLDGSSDPLTGASIPGSDVGRIEAIPPFFVGGPAPGPDAPVRNDDFAGDVLRFGFGVSYDAGGRRIQWAPVGELVGWHVMDGFATPPNPVPAAPIDPTPVTGDLPYQSAFIEEADGVTIVNLKLGARLRTSHYSLYAGVGFPLTNDEWYESIFRIEYRFSL